MDFEKVCDIPFCDEPKSLYLYRIEKGMTVSNLREEAARILNKSEEELIKEDYLVTELILFKVQVRGKSGKLHAVSYKNYNGAFRLCCDCRGWIYHSSRRCEHTEQVNQVGFPYQWK